MTLSDESTEVERILARVGRCLIDQKRARVVVPPYQDAPGFWFGGGNLLQDSVGDLWLVGRYRNHGDSRTGVGAGERGLELAIFHCPLGADRFEKVVTFSKQDLSVDGRRVLSIEGSALRWTVDGVELYVSTEKEGIGYPNHVSDYLKPGTGVWSIDRLSGHSVSGLRDAHVATVMHSEDPSFIHCKDPFLGSHAGGDAMLFCTHPYNWASSNTAFALIGSGENWQASAEFEFFPRGCAWDVAITRGTAVLSLPAIGALADRDVKLMFYDGGECVRQLDEHASAVRRPRGYSCEELGGLAYYDNDDLHSMRRISNVRPIFVSPHGTGCSRYVDVLETDDRYIATWQQAQENGSQALVMNVVPREEIESLVSHPS